MTSSAVRVGGDRPQIGRASVAELTQRLDRSRLASPAGEPWRRGVPSTWLAELVADWRSLDFEDLQARMDLLPHRSADIDGQRLHFLHVPGIGPDPLPLILTHGWPSTFCEFLDLIPLLADPQAHGGDQTDAFTVVVPSLPGFGFSTADAQGATSRQVAELWHRLMFEGLGYRHYAADGSDLGAGVTGWLARDHPEAVAGIHLATPGLAAPPQPWTPAETDHFAAVGKWTAEEGAYAQQHSTKPDTLAAGLLDSPVGLAAWIGEKVVAWSSLASDGQPRYPRRLLLDTLTIYWATGTIGSSMLPYWTYRHSPGAPLPAGDPPPVPTAISIFGGERVPFPKPPRELAERYFKISYLSEHDWGGHFPAVAEPQLLADILRRSFKPLRQNR